MPEKRHKLTREEMEAKIDGGESVLIRGTIYTTKESLPNAEDLADDDAGKAAALEDLDVEIARLQSRRSRIAPEHMVRKADETLSTKAAAKAKDDEKPVHNPLNPAKVEEKPKEAK